MLLRPTNVPLLSTEPQAPYGINFLFWESLNFLNNPLQIVTYQLQAWVHQIQEVLPGEIGEYHSSWLLPLLLMEHNSGLQVILIISGTDLTSVKPILVRLWWSHWASELRWFCVLAYNDWLNFGHVIKWLLERRKITGTCLQSLTLSISDHWYLKKWAKFHFLKIFTWNHLWCNHVWMV